MGESTSHRAPRYVTLIAVLALHVALISLLFKAGGVQHGPVPYQPLELVYIPAVPPPPVRAESGRPPRLRADIALSPVSPMNTSTPSQIISSGVGNRGLGVDWLAEAHRAVKAYEIRRDQPSDTALSGKSPPGDGLEQQGHHEGDEYKTDTGDWIVWIDAHCYKVASWHSMDPVSNADPGKIVCPKKSQTSR